MYSILAIFPKHANFLISTIVCLRPIFRVRDLKFKTEVRLLNV